MWQSTGRPLLSSSLVLLILVVACTGSYQSNPRISWEDIKVNNVSASIDLRPTTITEYQGKLHYETPRFRASAEVVMPPVPHFEMWEVGWIQACTETMFYNTYGDIAMSSWEIPRLRDGRVSAISDSDGKSYPWYGNTTERVILTGPRPKPTRLTVSMDDNFTPDVSWAVRNSNTPTLTRSTRDQSFTTWLAAWNLLTREFIVLQTVRWRMQLYISVDPNKPLGSRARLMGPRYQEQPQILDDEEPIPPEALVGPNGNEAQVLIWRWRN